MKQLWQTFATHSTNEISAAIRWHLDSGADALTGQGFKIGGGGSLTEAPTLRTFLLDLLGQIDPPAAAAYAQIILYRANSPDEWALALRNLARGEPAGENRVLLIRKTVELFAE